MICCRNSREHTQCHLGLHVHGGLCSPNPANAAGRAAAAVALVPAAVGVASGGCEAERSQAANSNIAATASEIMINTFLDMISSSEKRMC